MTDQHSNGFESPEGEEPLLPFGRPTERQSTRRETSDDAHRTALLSEQRGLLLYIIKQRPRTCDEIVVSGWAHQSASAGINWLMRQGHIVDSRERRKTSMGRRAIVWRYEPNPVPLIRLRPTRRELERRIEMVFEIIAEPFHDPDHVTRISLVLQGQADHFVGTHKEVST